MWFWKYESDELAFVDESRLLSGTQAEGNKGDSGDFKMAINVLVSAQNSELISLKSGKSRQIVMNFCFNVTSAEFARTH